MAGGLGGILSGAGGGNYVGGSIVRLLLDAAQFDAGLKTSEARLHGFGRRVTSVGRGMTTFGAGLTRNVTVPIVAAAAASTKMAIDYENAFTKVRANSNLTGQEINRLKDYVLELSGTTAKSPEELANGLYFLASAGLNATQVQQTLTMAAKASAAGLGEVGDVARLTANVLNAYADSGMTAKKATDILTAAVREGTAEPTEFAEAMGRILPIASRANVGFEEIAASLAGLSNIGLDVNEGVTAMRGLLQSIFAPTDAAAQAMKDLGLTSEQLRATLADGGLLAAMQLLEKRSGGNIDQLRDLIPNVRSLTGQLGLTGENADKVADSFQRVKNSSGSLDRAFKKTTKGEGFRYQKLLNDLRVTAIEFGEVLIPVLDDVIDGVSGVVEWFGNLSDGTKEAIVKWGLIAAALGPVVGLLGKIVSLGGSAIGVLSRLGAASAAGGVAGAAGTGAAAGGAAAGGSLLGALAAPAIAGGLGIKMWHDSAQATNEAVAAMEKYGLASKETEKAVEGLNSPIAFMIGHLSKQKQLLNQVSSALGTTEKAQSDYNNIVGDGSELTQRQRVRIGAVIGGFSRLGVEMDENTKQTTRNLLAVGDFDAALKNLRDSLDEGARKNGTFGKSARDAAGSTSVQAEKVAILNAQVRNLPSQKTVRINVVATGVESAVGSILAGLNTIASRIVSLPAPRVPGRAAGGPVNSGGTYLVGERGPELLHMGRGGGFVTPNGSPMRIVGKLQLTNGGAFIDGFIDQREHQAARSGRWQAQVAT